jgi:acetyl esterase/lipase
MVRGLLLVVMLATASALASAPDDQGTTLPTNAVQMRDVVYASRSSGDLRLDLFRPPGDGPFPLVIWIHGGGWHLGDKAAYPHMNFLVGHGYAVANLEYRLTQVAQFPAQIDDCLAALDFLCAHAGEMKLDPKRIFATGESAGAHLAALMGLERSAFTQSSSIAGGRIRGVIDIAGPTDLLASLDAADHPEMVNAIEHLLGGPPAEHEAMAKDASPLWHVTKNAPPFLIVHGTADPIVPIAQSEALADALRKAGADVEFTPLPGVEHVGPACWMEPQKKKILDFLARSALSKSVK